MDQSSNSSSTADTSFSIEPRVTAADKNALVRESRNVKRDMLKWFQGNRETLLCLQVRPHVRLRTPKRTRFALCNTNNRFNNCSIKTYLKCTGVKFTCAMIPDNIEFRIGMSSITQFNYTKGLISGLLHVVGLNGTRSKEIFNMLELSAWRFGCIG